VRGIAFPPHMDRANRNTALASAFVEELERSGVRHAVIAPGSRSTPLALALWRASGIETRVVIDERSAGFYALGAAQATGVPAAVLCTSGTAAANLHPAVCEADESGVPLIVLTADRPPELRGVGAGQTIDQLKLYGDAVRWFFEVGTHEADDAGLLHYRATACRAVAMARGELRPGPVHLNLPWREPLGDAPAEGEVTASSDLALAGRGDAPLTAIPHAGAPEPIEAVVEALAGHIRDCPRGLIVCGRQGDPALAEPIAAIARASGWPILAEPTSQLRFGPHDRSLVVSRYDAITGARASSLEPEAVLRFGEMPTSKRLRQWLAGLTGCRQHVVDDSFDWNEPTRHAAVIMRVSALGLANELAGTLDRRDEAEWAERWMAVEEAAAAAIESRLASDQLSEPAVHRALASAYADGDLVYTASSLPVRDQEAYAAGTDARVRFLCNRGANGIDGLVSSGIGAAGATGQPTWILTGDLGLFHDLNALSLLRETSNPVRVVVLDNRGGGIFEQLPQAKEIAREEFEALFGTPSGLDPARAAALWDIPHRPIERPGDVSAADDGPELIEAPTDRRAGLALRAELERAATEAVAATLS
jgi:2-succinyl-5-enolpyruvyl-6-hydroxy-3-cyclohexene-1-carboxylate synthase